MGGYYLIIPLALAIFTVQHYPVLMKQYRIAKCRKNIARLESELIDKPAQRQRFIDSDPFSRASMERRRKMMLKRHEVERPERLREQGMWLPGDPR